MATTGTAALPPAAEGRLSVGDAAPHFSVRPVFGLPVQVPPQNPLALCFVRHLGSSLARAALARMQERHADFDRLGVRLVAVSETDLEGAQDFVPRHHLLSAFVVDGDGSLHAAFGVERDTGLTGTLRGLRPERLRAALQSLQHGHGKPSTAVDRLPAEFLVDVDGTVRFSRYADTVLDPPDLDGLLAAASRTVRSPTAASRAAASRTASS